MADLDTRTGAAFDRRSVLAGAVAVTALATIGVRPAAAAASGVLIDAFTQEAVNFNPLLYVNTGCETAVEYAVFDTLWQLDPQGAFRPNLATEIPSAANGGISADGRTWTVKLRPDVKWHDGQPFTAADVVFTLKVLLDPKVVARSRNGLDHIATIEAVDDHTVKMTLKDDFAPGLVAWQKTSIVPKHILEHEADINVAPFNSNPVGTGPFVFKTRVAGDRIEFSANPDYHGGAPKLATLVQKFVPDQQTLFAQLQTGQVDIYDVVQGIPPQLYGRAKALPGVKVPLSATPFVEFIYFNCGKPQFSDKRVRQALYRAVDKSAWADAVYYGIPAPTLSYLPSSHWAYNGALKNPGHDPKEAAAMLDAAGWAVGTDGIRAKDGVKLSFTMSTTAGNKSREQAQQLVEQGWKKIGVDMQIHNMPASVVWGDYTVKSQFDTLMVAWDPLLYPDPDYTDRIDSKRIPAKGGSGSNYVQYENPEIDTLCAKGLATIGNDARKPVYHRIQEILLDDVPFAPIFEFVVPVGVRDRVGGYVVNPYTPCNSWNLAEWTVT